MAHLPERFGKYRVTSVLGEGAMGVVYKGFDPGIQRTVALKTIRRDVNLGDGSGASAAQRFRNEAQAAGRLAHPGIVGVYDFGEEGDMAYIAMEFVEGSSLARYLAKAKPFTDDDITSIAVQLLDALDHAHSHGVWHRDIKPANLMLTHEGKLKIADFGVARIEHTELTVAGSVIGTPGYMAPEQFLGETVDSRVDIYAAGVLLYQLLVGRPPFVGSTDSLLYRVVHEPPTLPSQVPGYERGTSYDLVLATALAKDRRQRFASPAAFRDAVIEAAGKSPNPRVSVKSLFDSADTPTEILPSSLARPSNMLPPAHWDPAQLLQVEQMLARHVGPMAQVLVRRSARACHDLPTLYARLAEQVTSPEARSAFLAESSAVRTGGRTSGVKMPGSNVTPPGPPSGVKTGFTTQFPPTQGAMVGDLLVAQATKLLAQHVGPIASVVARRALARGNMRSSFFAALLEAVNDDAARTKLRADLDKLP
jgi:eukaryotic-like serine/threonine-protein kinase